jgi:hypothetical protein
MMAGGCISIGSARTMSQFMALRHFWWVAHLCNDAAGSSER